jgi:peptidoglycan hydrolase-like protein with peptidoglycan-binding domain
MAFVGLLALPSAALAQGEPTPAPTPPVSADITVSVKGLNRGQVLAGTKYTVQGVVRPYVAGQKVTLRVSRHGRRLASRELSVKEDGSVGRFSLQLKAAGHGTTSVQAIHDPTPGMAAGKSATRKFRVVAPLAKMGSRGLAVRILQHRLAEKGYVVGRRGVYDARTARAVLAFRKVTGMPRTYEASSTVFSKLARGGGTFRVRFPSHGRHIEASLSKQVMALISGGKAIRIYPTSTGAPATPTIRGSFRVYRKDPGTNAKGMIHSSYFIRGYAIHGFVSVPVYPASHGCLRVPPAEALSIYNWVRIGTPVDVYW